MCQVVRIVTLASAVIGASSLTKPWNREISLPGTSVVNPLFYGSYVGHFKPAACSDLCNERGDCADATSPCFGGSDSTYSPGVNEDGCVSSWISDGWCDSTNNNEQCAYDGGDCCVCDCGRIVTETEANGVTSVETIYNGTMTRETTFADGTTDVYTNVTDETTYFTCGTAGLACIDPSSACVENDADNNLGIAMDGSVCDAVYNDCEANTECASCMLSAMTYDGDDCSPGTTYNCAVMANYYCCASDAENNECSDSPLFLSYLNCVYTEYAAGNECEFDSLCDYTGGGDTCTATANACLDDSECSQCWTTATDTLMDSEEGASCDTENEGCSGSADMYCCLSGGETTGCSDNALFLETIDCEFEAWFGFSCEFNSFCDYQDLDTFCSAEIEGCISDSECLECFESAYDSDDSSDYSSDDCEQPVTNWGCGDSASLMCCQLDAENNNCGDNSAVLNYVDCIHNFNVPEVECEFNSLCDYFSGATTAFANPLAIVVSGLATICLFL